MNFPGGNIATGVGWRDGRHGPVVGDLDCCRVGDEGSLIVDGDVHFGRG